MDSQTEATIEMRRLRIFYVAGGVLFFLATVIIILIITGMFDPRPFGSLVAVDQPGSQTVTEAGEAIVSQTAPWPAPPGRFSIRLTAAHITGESDSGYGLTLGDSDGRLLVALSPLGYVTVREERTDTKPVIHMPWQTWPHVQPGTAANEIWLDVNNSDDQAAVTVRINRELLWQGKIHVTPQQVGLYQTTFGGSAAVDFRQVEWFAEP